MSIGNAYLLAAAFFVEFEGIYPGIQFAQNNERKNSSINEFAFCQLTIGLVGANIIL